MAQPKFEVIEEESTSETHSKIDVDTILAGLRALPQKIAHAVASCFALITVATVFWLAMQIISNPNTLQLVGLAGYAVFVLMINWIVVRSRQ